MAQDKTWDGRPQNPERTAYHWVQLSGGGTHAAYWNKVEWNLGRDYLLPCEAAYSWRYVAPCPTPAEVKARVAAARREGIEAAAVVAANYQLNNGDCAAAIRALLEDGR